MTSCHTIHPWSPLFLLLLLIRPRQILPSSELATGWHQICWATKGISQVGVDSSRLCHGEVAVLECKTQHSSCVQIKSNRMETQWQKSKIHPNTKLVGCGIDTRSDEGNYHNYNRVMLVFKFMAGICVGDMKSSAKVTFPSAAPSKLAPCPSGSKT